MPFDFERRRLSVVVELLEKEGPRRLLVTKGAPESVLAVSTAFEAGGHVTPLDAHTKRACAALHHMCGDRNAGTCESFVTSRNAL